MKDLNIDWRAIRPLNGNRSEGFEELCSQLARSDLAPDVCFVRNGPPDAGVECYAIFPDDTEWGWQAKYFDTLGKSQWSQLDKSVRTALKGHPKLVRYFICVPYNLPDARLGNRQSAREKWENHVTKWCRWANAKGMSVEFVYLGSHELLTRLARSEHVGRIRFWFSVQGFDKVWFAARLDEALKTAGPRYTQEIHVDLPIATEFECFGRTARFFDSLKAHARSIREELRAVRYTNLKEGDEASDIASYFSKVTTLSQRVLAELGGISVQPIGELPLQKILEQVAAAETAGQELEQELLDQEREHDAKEPIRTRAKCDQPIDPILIETSDSISRLFDESCEA